VSEITIRRATSEDAGEIISMIHELAEFEKLLDIYEASEERLIAGLFSESPAARALVAQSAGRLVGYAIYFTTFSTFLTLPGIWLEDIYVRPQARRDGVGSDLFAAVAREVVEIGGGRMEWSALDWNERALTFYRQLGAELLDDWLMLRLSGEALHLVAGRSA